MRILFLTHSFNSLTQRLHVELTERGHDVSIELDINDSVTAEAVDLFQPDVVLAPFLKRAIPGEVWRRLPCLVVHPGIKGDRGPSSLDWAILDGETEWGVTVLQADAEMDAGDIWASAEFPMRLARKSSIYRNEVTDAAVKAVLDALAKYERGGLAPEPLDYGRPDVRGKLRPPMGQQHRAIDWKADDTDAVVRKIHASDGQPGVLDTVLDRTVYLFDAFPEDALKGSPGEIVATRNGAICRGTVDGAVWITRMRSGEGGDHALKLPATVVLGSRLGSVREVPADLMPLCETRTWREICYEERNGVGYLHFPFHNGAMSTEQCRRLLKAYEFARQRDTRVIVLMGGPDFWSNGIHLNTIEASESPADESWRNINAMNDLCRAVITTDSHVTLAAMQGNAGAGGVFFALAADKVFARSGVVLNPHYKNMGNLFGSEYWTYLLPRRVGTDGVEAVMGRRLPLGAQAAKRLGLVDDCFGNDAHGFRSEVVAVAEELAKDPSLEPLLRDKIRSLRRDGAREALEACRSREMDKMRLNFYGFDPSYHVARYNFVFRVPHSHTPLYLAKHRRRVEHTLQEANATSSVFFLPPSL